MAAPSPPRRKKKHARRHPGVVLLKPEGRNWWRARWVDPDSVTPNGLRVFKKETLPRTLTTSEQREDWAAQKSAELLKERATRPAGAPRATQKTIEDAVALFYETRKAKLRPVTLVMYRLATDKLVRWAASNGVKKASDLTATKLAFFRDAVASEPKRVPVEGARRGVFKKSNKPRSALAINRDLRSVHTVLQWARKKGLLPKLHKDDLTDQLERENFERDQPTFLDVKEIQMLLKSALAHDAATFKTTRLQARGKAGITMRFEPIAPMIAIVLLTGMRLNEALTLKWTDVDLDNKVIRLDASHVKTRQARDIDLSVCHSIVTLLRVMRRDFGSVLGLSRDVAEDEMQRLKDEYGAPSKAGWQCLRRTCSTYSMSARSIWGDAAPFLIAKRMGHSIAIAFSLYAREGVPVPRDAKRLETAMGISSECAHVLCMTRAARLRNK